MDVGLELMPPFGKSAQIYIEIYIFMLNFFPHSAFDNETSSYFFIVDFLIERELCIYYSNHGILQS